MSDYLVVIEQEGDAWGAYAPDLPGLGVAGETREEAEALVKDAIREHVQLLRDLGRVVPAPRAAAAYVQVA